MMRATRLLLCLSMLMPFVLMGSGCNRVTAGDVRRNPTPELQTVAMSREQRKNLTSRNWDHTRRQIHDDWDMFWLSDRPRRMTKYPMP